MLNQKRLVEELRKARLALGLSQEELARRIGTKQPSINQMEKGKRPLTFSMLERLAPILGERFRPHLDI
jgi:transcriptional regulator with XRE-family HTH domain